MTIADLTATTQQLQNQIAGGLITPDHPDYEQARRGWNLSLEQRPALILVAGNAQDVVAGVNFARQQGLGIGVKSTGHGLQYPADDNLLIVTTKLDAVEIDPAAATMRVEAGVIWQQVLDAAIPHGLAPLLGTAPHVGVMGYTLGGGIGWLGRRHGLAADSVLAIDVVTPDGVLRHVGPTENPDLFWALRGSGGNFGVVTGMEVKLYPVATIYGGSLTYPGEVAADALRFFREWSKTVPDDLTSSLAVMKFPALPQVPEFLRGKNQIIVRAAFVGSAEAGHALLQPWLDWRTPDSNSFREMPFAEIATIQNDPVNPTPSTSSSEMFDELSDEAIDIIVRTMTDAASPLLFSELRHAGGAIARADREASAICNRDITYLLVIGALVFSPEARTAIQTAVTQYKAALQPYVHGGVYLNFMAGTLAGGEVRARTPDAYTAQTLARLVALKAQYDPDRLFRYSYQLGRG